LEQAVNHQELYEDAVRRLLVYGYEVFSDESGYRVQHRTDSLDISLMRDVSDLVDFANLMDWADQRRSGEGDMALESQKLVWNVFS
jgi:hypothetical protein